MKKLKYIVAIIIFAVIVSLSVKEVKADISTTGVPYKTYTYFDGRLRETPTAYIPLQKLTDSRINQPEDLYLYDNMFFIANGTGKNVLVYDMDMNFVREVGKGILDTPTGIHVKDDLIYVADRIKQAVFVFDIEGNLIKTLGRPTEALFGSSANYVPEKVVVDDRGNVYVTGSGATNGVIQMNNDGKFLGYFAVNKTNYSFLMTISKLLNIESIYAKNLPSAPSNLGIDSKGLVYTVTAMDNVQVKKFDFASNIMLENSPRENEQVRDVYIDEYSNIFYVTNVGTIYEFDKFNNLLFTFGGQDIGSQRLGLLQNPTGIVVDHSGNIYCLDKNGQSIEVYGKTNFASLLDMAIKAYDRGDLESAKAMFEEILFQNETYALANKDLGKIYLKEGEYEKALEAFRASRYKSGYSEAFWEVRNAWLSRNLNLFIGLILGLALLAIVLRLTKVNRKIKAFNKGITSKCLEYKTVREFKLVFTMLRHPLNTLYDIQRREASSYLTATILYALMFIFQILAYFQTSFLFRTIEPRHINVLMELAKQVGIPLLFVVSNYLMSALADGDGRFKDIYIATAYCLAPMLLVKLPIAWLTNGLTYNETFLIDVINWVANAYTLFLLFFMIKDIHYYSVSKTIKNILLTIFTMLIIVALLFIVYVLVYQMMGFIIEIVKEVIVRAT